ncbi:erythropoietin receptor-like [Salvelinus fontinalis]|uniref:erythropoietin receptor-like n=1 Tax=Salvelinus fontinalis TaxID=8038 RepID=UPI002486498C|nr:erythropoietin receptor-like [Salvelinus fontinalis]
MTNDNLNKLLVICVLFCAQKTSIVHGSQALETKVALLLHAEPEIPKCFAEGMSDLTCFWEEDEERTGSADQYSFIYTYQNENSSECAVTALPAAGGKRLYFCRLSQTQLFVPLDIRVFRDDLLIHNRSLFIELVFLLDPPANLTLTSTGTQGQLKASWLPPSLKYMGDSMMYEVSYAMAGSHIGKVEEVQASSELILRGLQSGTKYKVRIRAKLDGISYSGYWSAWTDPVLMETMPGDLDPLIVSLSLIISLVLTLLSLIVLMSHRRFLLKKIWPIIPTPESKFQGLFKVYGGDFQEWLGHNTGGLWLRPAYFYSEEFPAPLEVLSEVSLGPALPSSALPPKASEVLGEEEDEDKKLKRVDSALMEGWREIPQEHWPMDQLRAIHQHPAPWTQSSLLESHDAYVTLNAQNHSGEEPLDDILEETLPLQVLFASGRTSSESRSDLGSFQQSSGSGCLSSQSSFEYPNHTWPPKGPGYTYMAVADSGVSMDYSPMSSNKIDDIGKRVIYTNEYKNEIPAHRRPIGTPIHFAF